MIDCLAGLRMRHLEERGGLRGLSVPTISAPTADGRQHRRVPASRNPVRSTSSLLFTLHVPMCPPLHAPTCARNPPAPSGRFVLTILSYSQPTGFNHPLTPLNLSHRGVPTPPQSKVAFVPAFHGLVSAQQLLSLTSQLFSGPLYVAGPQSSDLRRVAQDTTSLSGSNSVHVVLEISGRMLPSSSRDSHGSSKLSDS